MHEVFLVVYTLIHGRCKLCNILFESLYTRVNRYQYSGNNNIYSFVVLPSIVTFNLMIIHHFSSELNFDGLKFRDTSVTVLLLFLPNILLIGLLNVRLKCGINTTGVLKSSH